MENGRKERTLALEKKKRKREGDYPRRKTTFISKMNTAFFVKQILILDNYFLNFRILLITYF